MKVTFDHSKDEAPGIKTFYFKPEGSFHYTAGQFIQLTLPHDNPDERGTKRWFTLSSSPTEPFLSITTRIAPKNGSSFKRTLLALQPKQPVHMTDAMGDFVLPKDKDQELVFVAGGIGITPIRSMVKWLNDNKESRSMVLIHAVSQPDDLVFKTLFEQSSVIYLPQIMETPVQWVTSSKETMDTAKIAQLAFGLKGKLIYIAGPEPMVEKLNNDLLFNGIPNHQIVTDFYPGYVGI